MKKLFCTYKLQILYLIFGIGTTLINITLYNLCYYQFLLSNFLSNMISWLISVLFAYVSNKIWVFENKDFRCSVILKELSSFMLCRVLTGALDILIMFVSVDVFEMAAWLFKILSNIIVIICNFIASKIIFVKREKTSEEHQN